MTANAQNAHSFDDPYADQGPRSINDILDRLCEQSKAEGDVTVGRLLESFGRRSQGPVLLLPALLEMSPIGGIPGLPTVLATIVIIFAVQIAIGHDHLWLPGIVEKRRIPDRHLAAASDKLRPVANRLDRWFYSRWHWLTGGMFVRIAAIVSILLALTVPALELIPFASTIPMLAIALFGMSLFVRDGKLMIAALFASIAAFGAGGYFLFAKVL